MAVTRCMAMPDEPLDANGEAGVEAVGQPVPIEASTIAAVPVEVLSIAAAPVEVEEAVAPEPLPTVVIEEAPALAEPRAIDDAAETEPARPTIQLDRKHLLAIRWMHWVNFPVLFIMIWSGLLIYWNDSDNAYLHAHRVYRVGIGGFTLFRLFPDWFYKLLNVPYHVTQGLGNHFFFMWIFALNGIVYVLYTALSGEWRFLLPQRRSVRDAIQVTLVDLHLREGLPPQTKYNGAQRIAYTSVIVMGAGMLLTGLAIYKPTSAHWLTSLLGGYEMARWLHFWLTIGFLGFFGVHVGQVILAGWNNFRSMVSGYEIKRAEEHTVEAERRTW